MHRLGLAITLLFLPPVAACTSNGSSSGRSPDYPHASNFVLTEGQTYLKNPDVKLRREYWIVARAENGTHFMVPRPDGDPRIVEECTTGGPLASMFAEASLCQTASATTLGRVNALTVTEAMRTSTFLHDKLRFTAKAHSNAAGVDPFPHTDDLLEICKTFPDDRNGTLRGICDEELHYENASQRPTIARSYTADESRVIAARLNEIYGIQ